MWRRAAVAFYASGRSRNSGRCRDLWTNAWTTTTTRSELMSSTSTPTSTSSSLFRPPPAAAAAAPLLVLHSRSIGGVPEGAQIFDRDLKRAHRDRAAWLRRRNKKKDDPLVAEVASRLVDRLADCSPRVSGRFRRALLLGAEPAVIDCLAGASSSSSSSPIAFEEVTVVDSSSEKLRVLSERFSSTKSSKEEEEKQSKNDSDKTPTPFRLELVRADEETFAPPESTYDVVLSCGGLHWVNDLPGLLTRCRKSLVRGGGGGGGGENGNGEKDVGGGNGGGNGVGVVGENGGGVFLAAVPGGDSLHELRRALARAELDAFGGVSARVSPMIRMRDAGSLLGRAGFSVPGVDVDEIVVRYSDATSAIDHLRELGESNAVRRRDARPMRRGVARAAMREYERVCAEEDEREGGGGGGGGGFGGEGEKSSGGGGGGDKPSSSSRSPSSSPVPVRSTFEIFYLTGWAPPEAGSRGPRAAERGSATVSFRDLAEAVAKRKRESEEEKDKEASKK